MRVLVTGASGLIGRQVLSVLTDYNVEAVGLDAAPFASTGSEVVSGDIRDREELIHIFRSKRVERVIHCAAVLQSTCYDDPVLGVSVNVLGTLNVLEAARLSNVTRVVMASSIATYGRTRVDPMSEGHPCEPLGIYGTSKLLAEQIGEAFEKKTGVECVALRYGLVYGPAYVRTKGVAAEFQSVLRGAVNERIIRIPAAGQRFPFIYSYDAAVATARACIATPAPAHRIFNISACGKSMEDVAGVLVEIYPEAVIERDRKWEPSPINGDLDTTLAASELGFRPTVEFDDGLKLTCGFFEKMEAQSV